MKKLLAIAGTILATTMLVANAKSVAKPWRLEMEHVGGWGAGTLAAFKMDFEGNYTFSEWSYEKRGGEKKLAEQCASKLPKEVAMALVKMVEEAPNGPQAEDAGIVRFTWRDGNGKVALRSYTLPREEPCRRLMESIRRAALAHVTPKEK
jgi:hypothetical protein